MANEELLKSYETVRVEKSKEIKKIYLDIQKMSVEASMLAGAIKQLDELIKNLKGGSK